MRLLYPAMLFFLILIPVIVILYMIRQKAVKKQISAVFLWQEAYRSLRADTPWEKLKHNLLMYLQIAAMLLLVAALAAPLFSGWGNSSYSHVILVVDNSAGMQADYNTSLTRLEAAKQEAEAYVRALPADTRVMVLASSDQAELLQNDTANHTAVLEALDGIGQSMLPGNASAALEFCRTVTAQWEEAGETDYEIMVFSDTPVEFGDLRGRFFSLQSAGKNLAVDYASHTAKDGAVTVLAKVSDRGTEEYGSEVDVSLYAEDKLAAVKTVNIPQGGSELVYFDEFKPDTELSAAGLKLRVEISAKDALAADNTAYDVCGASELAGAQNNKKVLLVTEQNVFLEKALQTEKNLELFKSAEPETAAEQVFDLYVFDGIFPKQLPKAGNLLLLNPGEEEISWLSAAEKEGGYLAFTENSFSSYLNGYTFGTNRYHTYEAPAWTDTFLKDSDGHSAGLIGTEDGRKTAVLGVDLHEGDFPLQSEFPVFIYELLGELLERRLTDTAVYTAGQEIELNFLSGEPLEIRLPDEGGKELLRTGASVSYHAKDCGIYTLEQQVGEEKVTEYAAVNFPVDSESDLQVSVDGAAFDTDINGAAAGVTAVSGKDIRLRVPLLLLALLTLLGITVLKWREDGSAGRRNWLRVSRGLAAILIVAALFDPVIKVKNSFVTTIYLADVSESMSGTEAEAADFIKKASENRETGDRTAVVAFGADSRVEQFVTNQNLFGDFETVPVKSSTDLEQAVRTAMTMFPESGAKRIVLLTDGGENSGDVLKLADTLQKSNTELMVHQLSQKGSEEVYLSDIRLPERVNTGDQFAITVSVESNVSTAALLHLFEGSEEKAVKSVQLRPGGNQFVFTDTRQGEGLAAYRAIIEAENDTISQNNEYASFTNATAKPLFLLLEKSIGENDEFQRVLDAAGIRYEVKTVRSAPQTILDMTRYKGIFLMNVGAYDLPEGFMGQVESYVKDYGGGLAATGGSSSFALGGYRNTVLEKILPVDMDLKNDMEIPGVAIAFVIDHSGSMSDASKLELAKGAAAAAAGNLRSFDRLGVLAFDDSYRWVLPFTGAGDSEAIRTAIAGIADGGGTSIYPAVEAAYQEIKKETAPLKHIILLTDGQDGYGYYNRLAENLRASGVTMSTVAVGADADTRMLEKLAEDGGGRYYFSKDPASLPDIFTQEVNQAMGEYLVNREFVPQVVSSGELLAGVSEEGLYPLYGYIASTAKSTASRYLVSDTGDPILTGWRYGLGKTVAFNSDVSGKWTAEYIGTAEYTALWKNIADWLSPDVSEDDGALTFEKKGDQIKFLYETSQYTAETEVAAVVTDETGNTSTIELTAALPGKYEAEINLEEEAVYSVFLQKSENGTIVSGHITGLALPYSKEYQFVSGNVLEELVRQTGGSFIETADQVQAGKAEETEELYSVANLLLIAAVLFFFLDIILMRFGLYPAGIVISGAKKISVHLLHLRAVKKAEKPVMPQKTEKAPDTGEQAASEGLTAEMKKKKENKRAEPVPAERIDVSVLLKKKEERRY